MPHFPRPSRAPRSLATSHGVPPETQAEAPGEEAAAPRRAARTLGLGRISLHRHDVDPAKVFKQLFGTEARTDEYTGQLVFPAGGAAARGGPPPA